MRIINRTRTLGAALLALALVLTACGGDEEPGGGPDIVIGSYGFAESEIIGEIYRLALEAEGFTVSHSAQLGSREAVVYPALRSGDINVVPEYIGSGLEVGFGGVPTADSDDTRDALKEEWEKEGFTVLDYTPAQDKNGIVVTGELAASLGLTKISDLQGQSQSLIFGGPSECPQRPRCLGGLESVYGLSFAEFKALDTGGPLTVEALAGGEVDVGLLFTSDGVIAARGFVLLDDDEGLQPAENIAPVVSEELVDAYGGNLTDVLNDLSAEMSQEELTELNRLVSYEGESATDMARQWLEDNGLI